MEALTRGDDATRTITIANADETPMDLTGCTVRFTAKRRRSDAQADAIIRKSTATDDGITLLPQAGETLGQATLDIAGSDTASLEAYRVELHVDVQVTTSTGKVYTPIIDTVVVNPDVTTPA